MKHKKGQVKFSDDPQPQNDEDEYGNEYGNEFHHWGGSENSYYADLRYDDNSKEKEQFIYGGDYDETKWYGRDLRNREIEWMVMQEGNEYGEYGEEGYYDDENDYGEEQPHEEGEHDQSDNYGEEYDHEDDYGEEGEYDDEELE